MSITGKGIAEDAVIKQSVIGEHSTVDHGCVVLNARIGDYVDLEKRNLIRRAEIGDMTYTGADTGIMWARVGKYCCNSAGGTGRRCWKPGRCSPLISRRRRWISCWR